MKTLTLCRLEKKYKGKTKWKKDVCLLLWESLVLLCTPQKLIKNS